MLLFLGQLLLVSLSKRIDLLGNSCIVSVLLFTLQYVYYQQADEFPKHKLVLVLVPKLIQILMQICSSFKYN